MAILVLQKVEFTLQHPEAIALSCLSMRYPSSISSTQKNLCCQWQNSRSTISWFRRWVRDTRPTSTTSLWTTATTLQRSFYAKLQMACSGYPTTWIERPQLAQCFTASYPTNIWQWHHLLEKNLPQMLSLTLHRVHKPQVTLSCATRTFSAGPSQVFKATRTRQLTTMP